MITKAGLRKRYQISGRTIDESRLRRLFDSHSLTPLDDDQFRALLFDLLVEEVAKGEMPSAETISSVLTDTCRDQDDLDAAVQRKQQRWKCQEAHVIRVADDHFIDEIIRTREQLDGNRDSSTTDSDGQSSEVCDQQNGLVANCDALGPMLRQEDTWAKVLEIEGQAFRHIAVVYDRLLELSRESFDVDAPNYARIDELKSLTKRLRDKIDVGRDESPETRADLENAEQELGGLREIRDDQHLPLTVALRLSELVEQMGSEFEALLWEPWPLSKEAVHRQGRHS